MAKALFPSLKKQKQKQTKLYNSNFPRKTLNVSVYVIAQQQTQNIYIYIKKKSHLQIILTRRDLCHETCKMTIIGYISPKNSFSSPGDTTCSASQLLTSIHLGNPDFLTAAKRGPLQQNASQHPLCLSHFPCLSHRMCYVSCSMTDILNTFTLCSNFQFQPDIQYVNLWE